jgi:ATPase subunit of ABC transporter with duplicated ATPase domains
MFLAAYEAQQMERAHMQEFVDKFYSEKRSSAQNSRVRLAMSRQKALEKMELIPDPRLEVVSSGILFLKIRASVGVNVNFGHDVGSGLDALSFSRTRRSSQKCAYSNRPHVISLPWGFAAARRRFCAGWTRLVCCFRCS